MAFQTQKDFFNLPFMDESDESGCKKACVKLKSYESTEDARAWASDETKRSKFLSDLVTCKSPIGEGEGDFNNTNRQVALTSNNADSVNNEKPKRKPNSYDVSKSKEVALTGNNADSFNIKNPKRKPNSYDGTKSKETLASGVELMPTGDSLLQCANVHLAEYQKLLQINTILEEQLEVSKEQLKTAKIENTKIREILANKLDSNTAKDFYNKIKKFTTAGKFNKNEENEMLQIYQKMENMNKYCETLEAEKHYLRRLIEKLTNRVKLESIPIQPEQSLDIAYLQKEINSLRKECLMLRHIEDDYQRSKQQQARTLSTVSEQEAEQIKVIMKERNSLREKCKTLQDLEQQVEKLEYETQQAKKETNDLNSILSNKTQYIDTIEGEMQNMQKYYEKIKQDSNFREECLKAQLEDLKDEFVKAKCEAQKAQLFAMEVSCLRNELLNKDLALNDYDCQYKQLMDVVNELKSVQVQCINDNETQTCNEQTDELTFYTCATLEEILKELKRRGCLDNELVRVYDPDADPGYVGKQESDAHCCTEVEHLKQQLNEMKQKMQSDGHCCTEVEHLKQQLNEMKQKMREETNCDEICNDTLERLKELETLNSQLLHDNRDLNAKLIEAENKLVKMLKQLEKLDADINRNGQEATVIGRGLEENIALVKNISDVQLKNQQLANAVSAINSRDDEKIIEDLRRQLDEELSKLKKCQQDNVYLTEEKKQLETSLKEVKELNNKLLAENNRLKSNAVSIQSKTDNKREDKTDETKYKEKPADTESTGKNISIKKGVDQEAVERKKEEFEKRKQSGEIQQKPVRMQETKTSPSSKQKPISVGQQKITDHAPSSSKQKPISVSQQKIIGFTPSSSKQIPINLDQQNIIDFTDLDAFETSSRTKETTRKKQNKDIEEPMQLSHDRPKTKSTGEHKSSPSKDTSAKQFRRDQSKDLALNDFVNKRSDSLKLNLQKGHCFEKEFRKILEEFMLECSSYFCRLFNAKSKLYIICHKLCHNGIDVLNFQELAYIHKKIYNQADKLLPGCMLDMILTEHREQVESILTSVVMPRLMESKRLSFKTSDVNLCNDDQKCCCCKNELCCNNSDEILKDKVSKLEKDIVIAREYLETLRNIPLDDGLSTDNDNSTDTNNSTYRASSPVPKQQQLGFAKHVKKIKSRTKKPTGI